MSIPWLRGDSAKGIAVKDPLSRVIEWRRTCGLAGGTAKYDHLLGCLGNPNADIVFLAEIPSLNPPGRRALPHYPSNERWKMMWNVSPGDKTFRDALVENGFIPDGASDEPWRWRCWVTDIVKCAARDKVWKRIKRKNRNKRQRILAASSAFLKEELQIIRPKMIVVMGNATADLFDEFVQTDVLDVRIPHYARMTRARKPLYLARFQKIAKWHAPLR